MVIAAAGALEHDAVVDEVEQRFAGFDGPASPRRSRRASAAARMWRRASSNRCTSRSALEGVPQTDPSLHSLQVFSIALGGGMSSRLFQEVRENRGLCYSIYAFHAPYQDIGLFALYAGTDAADADELMRRRGRRNRQRGGDHHRKPRSPAPRRR